MYYQYNRYQFEMLPPPVDTMCSSIGHVAGWGEVCEELPLISLGETFPPAQDEFMFNMLPTILKIAEISNINNIAFNQGFYNSSKCVTVIITIFTFYCRF